MSWIACLCPPFFDNRREKLTTRYKRGDNLARLTTRQNKFLKEMLLAQTVSEACRRAGISRETGYKYMKDEAFVAEYRRLRRETMDQVTAQLQQISKDAVSVLYSVMTDKEAPTSARVQSAKNVLEMAYRALELDDVQERIEKLEAVYEKWG